MKKFKIIYKDENNKLWLKYTVGTWNNIVEKYNNNNNTLEKAATFGKAELKDHVEWEMETDVIDSFDLLR